MDAQTDREKLMERIRTCIEDGLSHGFFEFSIAGEMKNRKCHVVVQAGKSFKFVVPTEAAATHRDS